MLRHLPILNGTGTQQAATTRSSYIRLGVWVEAVTILWMIIEAGVAITVGVATHSVSLQGFGIDSLIELIVGGVLLWRLLVEQHGGQLERIERAEGGPHGSLASACLRWPPTSSARVR